MFTLVCGPILSSGGNKSENVRPRCDMESLVMKALYKCCLEWKLTLFNVSLWIIAQKQSTIETWYKRLRHDDCQYVKDEPLYVSSWSLQLRSEFFESCSLVPHTQAVYNADHRCLLCFIWRGHPELSSFISMIIPIARRREGGRDEKCINGDNIARTLWRLHCKQTVKLKNPIKTCVSDCVNCFTVMLSGCSKHRKLCQIFLVMLSWH